MGKGVIRKVIVQWLAIAMLFQNMAYASTDIDISEPELSGEIVQENITGAVSENMATKVNWYLGDKSVNNTHGAVGSIAGNDLRLYALRGFGKIVHNTKDAKVFYYTPIPADKNFTLSCKAHINDWTFTNGQEGFGIMAADKEAGTSSFWNNSVDAIVTSCSYAVSNGTVNLQNGPCALVRYGVTEENIAELDSDTESQIAMNKYFNKYQYALYDEISVKGTYNLLPDSVKEHDFDVKRAGAYDSVKNPTGYEPQVLESTVENPVSDYRLTIQKNNSGYFVSYTDAKGKTNTRKFYYCGNDFLTSLVKDTVYAGFFVARNMDVTFSDIDLRIVEPSEDAPAEKIEENIYDLSAYFSSSAYCNSEDYKLFYRTNWNGKLKITDEYGEVIFDDYATTEKESICPVKLDTGVNQFTAYFEPDKEYHYGYDQYHPANKYNVLSSYEPKVSKFRVTRNTYEKMGEKIYVAPSGTGDGSKDKPMDFVNACKFVQPGQCIIMLPGVYKYNSGILIPRSVNGEKGRPITLMGDPDSKQRPVLDFNRTGNGITFAGNYWYLKGFDVTKSSNASKGMAICGSYVVAEDIHTYKNGNTGLDIFRLSPYDTKEEYWPHDILVKNCLSYENADAGYEDADGFAAKITSGENIVFDGCVSHHNADDGWDLYSKKEIGCIGAVTIRNSVAYSNGYIHGSDGSLIVAGNGNGYKLGGDNLSGKHILENCYSFNNKANGIDSNTCPDVRVSNCVSLDNGKANIAVYTSALNTDFHVKNVISLRYDMSKIGINDIYRVKNQNQNDVFNNTTFYWVDNKTVNSVGTYFANNYVKSFTFDTEKDEIRRHEDGSIDLGDFLQFRISEVGGVDIGSIGLTEQMSAEEILNRGETITPSPMPLPTVTSTPTVLPTVTPTPTALPTPTATGYVIEQCAGNGRKLKLSAQLLEPYSDSSLITVISKDKSGKACYSLKISPKDFTLGNELYLFKIDSDISAFGTVNKKKYKIGKKGIGISIKEAGNYILVPQDRVDEICQKIEAGILLEADSVNIPVGEKTLLQVTDAAGLNSIKKIQYKSLDKKIAVVNKSGELTVKGTGKVIVEARITLKNGIRIIRKVEISGFYS